MNVISLIGPAKASYRYEGLAALATRRSIIATWSERMRFRWDLQQMASANSHLIDDIGLTTRQVEAEISKPFWQA
ncbi:MAG TPA: DUF1127 domain-containing protein [Rhizobiaceae bacterium]|nr:DUF1127 domain-containing protein [Rhizobiaceae bacterium]